MKLPLLPLAFAGLLAASLTAAVPDSVVLNIPSTPEHPRNSEGAFVTLHSGRIEFYFSQFSGGYSDYSTARIAEIHSDDQGRTWSAPHAFVEKAGGINLMSVSALRLASGQLALFYGIKKSGIDCIPYLLTSRDEAATWSEPNRVVPAPGYFVLNNDRVIQTSSGRLILPVAFNRSLLPNADVVNEKVRPNDYRGIIIWYLSDDEGATWREADTWWTLPIASETGLQEPGVVELADGSLYSWARTGQGRQYSFRSRDGGKTWSPPEPTELLSPCSPASIKRLPGSDALLAIYNDYSFPHPTGRSAYRGRTPLVAAISHDGGRTWGQKKLLENDPNGEFAYIAVHFVGDSVLLGYSAGQTGKGHLGSLRIRRVSLAWLEAAP